MDGVTKEYLKSILQSKGVDAYLDAVKVVQTGIPIPLLGIDYSHFVDENIVEPLNKIREYNSLFRGGLTSVNGKGLLIYGGAGSGKTALACLSLKNAVLNGASGKFILFETLANSLLQQDDSFDADVLVVDGFGDIPNFHNSKLFSWVIGRLETFLRERYYRLRPTIYTTRLSKGDLARVFPSGLVSFLYEATIFIDLSNVSDHRPKLKGKSYARRISKGIA